MVRNWMSSRGGSLVAAAAIAGAAFAGMAGVASASMISEGSPTVIYQDSFTGSTALGTLNGASPTTGPTGVTWTAPTATAWGFSDSGYTTSGPSGNVNARLTASLPFTPTSGKIYTLSAGLDVTAMAPGDPTSTDDWFALGYLSNQDTSGGWDGNGQASPWALSRYTQTSVNSFTGPSLNGGQGYNESYVNNISIILNTASTDWSYQVYLNNANVSNYLVGSGTFTTNPTITAVGVQNGLGTGYISNFELTSVSASPVPEPSTLAIIVAGGMGLLLLKRRKAV